MTMDKSNRLKSLSLIICALLFSGNVASAQTNQALRDSLERAIDQLEYHPDSVDLRLRKAAWNLELNQWEYAKEEYDKILRYHPDNLAALFFRAFANEKMGRYNFARIDYESFLRIVPGHFEASLGLALLNEKDKHYTEAMDQMNRLVEQYPDSTVAYAARAGMERDRGQLELAEYDFIQALKRDSKNKEYILALSDVLIMEEKYTEARRGLDYLITLGVSKAVLRDYYKRLK